MSKRVGAIFGAVVQGVVIIGVGVFVLREPEWSPALKAGAMALLGGLAAWRGWKAVAAIRGSM